MKTKRIIAMILCLISVLTIGVIAYADNGGFAVKYYGGVTDNSVTGLPADGAAQNGSEFNVSNQIPQREGYEFIEWILDYSVQESEPLKVTYVATPDPTYGSPEGVSVPIDTTQYENGQSVTIAPPLTTIVGYAYNEKGEMVSGTWEFTTWDKGDFSITEDTTVTGYWKFTPDPAKVYNYTVEYWLVDGSQLVTKVAEDKPGTVDALGDKVTEEAIPMGSKLLNVKYRSPNKYRIKPHWETVTATITKDNYVIYIFYELIPHGQ